jgi:hypothetical protein
MRFWWVNQNQTFRQEIAGGYLWSAKRNANGARNPFYESMREVAPGDLIFSFVDTRVAAIGIIRARRGQGLFKQRLCELKRAVASEALIIRVTYWPATANRGGIPRMKNV